MKIGNFKLSILLYVFLAILITVALLIRTIGIFSNNILFLFDNARDLLYIQKIVLQHKLLLIGPSSGGLMGYFHGVFWYYLLTIPFILGNGNPATITLSVAILSTASILLTFWVLKQTTNIYAAIFGATIYAFATFSLATAKFPWNPYPIVWLIPLYFYALHSFIQKRTYALTLIAFLTSLFIHFEAIYGITLLPTLMIVGIMHFFRKPDNQSKLKPLFIAILAFLIPLIPMLIFDVRHHFLIISNLLKTFTTGGQNITHSASEHPLSFAIRFHERMRDFFAYTFNVITNNYFVNIFLLITFFGGLLYLIKTVQKQKVFFICLCLITLISSLIFFLFLKYAVWSYYWIGNAPLYSLLLAFVIGEFFHIPSLRINNLKLKFFFILMIILIILYNPFQYFPHWYKGDIEPGTQTFSMQLQAVNTIYKDAGSQPFSVYISTPPLYDYIYRYLFSWTARTQHLQIPEDKKQRLTYVILEYQLNDPLGNYFKKYIVNTANESVKTWKFSGMLIEKIITSPQEKAIDPNYFPQL